MARDIPGLFDALFPQLVPGVVAHFNRTAQSVDGCIPLPQELVTASSLQRAMLFEVAVAAGDQLVTHNVPIGWDSCLEIAVIRQRRHFDAKLPTSLSSADKAAALLVGTNLSKMLYSIRRTFGDVGLVHSPKIPGYRWISSGVGDYSLGTRLIEVKCTNKHFSSSDYRQVMMYWLLSYASAVENEMPEWSSGILLNPRLNLVVTLSFDEMISAISAGRSKVDLLELFSSMVGGHTFHMLASIQ